MFFGKTMRQLKSMAMKIKIKKQLWLLMFAFCKGSTKVLLRYAWILKVLADSSGEDWNPLENFLLFFQLAGFAVSNCNVNPIYG